MTVATIPLRFRLKNATADAHAALEQRIGPLQQRDEYNEYVRGLHHFRSSAEAWVARFGFRHSSWSAQRIEPHLRQDIDDLGLAPLRERQLDWAPAGASFALGVHYVLEGSALGARVLCKQVVALGFNRSHGARHLWAQADTPGNWRGFLDCLTEHERHADETALIAGANAAFAAAAASMDRAAHD